MDHAEAGDGELELDFEFRLMSEVSIVLWVKMVEECLRGSLVEAP